MPAESKDPFDLLRKEIRKLILKKYKTAEEFCWAHDLPKATVSNCLTGKKDTRISTLQRILKALDQEIEIRLK